MIRLTLPHSQKTAAKNSWRIVHNRMEETRVRIRNVRRDLIKDLRDFEKKGLLSEDDRNVGEKNAGPDDKLTKKVDEIGEQKRKEIMDV